MKEFKDNSDELFKDDDQPTEVPLDESEPIESEGVSELQAERDELFDRLQRVSADYQNAVKRHQQQLNDQVAFAKGDLLRAFLPVLDHFDNALAAEPESDEAKALHQGLAIVRDELLRCCNNPAWKKSRWKWAARLIPHNMKRCSRKPRMVLSPTT